MGGIVAPWIIRPIPNTGPVSGGAVRPIPGSGIRPPFPVSPGYPSSVTRPAAMENGQAIARPAVTAREAEESARNRKKDCRCLPSVRCEGKPSFNATGETERINWIEYQLYIANMNASFAFEYVNGLITEWEFGGDKRWDGFWQKSCTLLEMKGRYGFLANIKEGVLLKSRLESFIDVNLKVVIRLCRPIANGQPEKLSTCNTISRRRMYIKYFAGW